MAGCSAATTLAPADAGEGADATPTDAAVLSTDAATDAVTSTTDIVGPDGGTVNLLHFAAFGDARPPSQDDVGNYPVQVIQSVFQGIQGLGVPFAVGTGDYMFASTADSVDQQLTLFLTAEHMYTGWVIHAMGNHECNGYTVSNCPSLNEYPNVQGFRARLQADLPNVYHDFVVHTSMGDAHFIIIAANAWSTDQETWLTSALAAPGMRYTFVAMHEPPSSGSRPAGATAAEQLIDATSGVTLRLYGHTHEYRREGSNAVITGNAGAPLSGRNGAFGFVEVLQRADGNLIVNEFHVGNPATLSSSFVVTPTGQMAQ